MREKGWLECRFIFSSLGFNYYSGGRNKSVCVSNASD